MVIASKLLLDTRSVVGIMLRRALFSACLHGERVPTPGGTAFYLVNGWWRAIPANRGHPRRPRGG